MDRQRDKNDFNAPPQETRRELEVRKLKEQLKTIQLKNELLEKSVSKNKRGPGQPEKYSEQFHPMLAQLFYAQGGIDEDFAKYIGVSVPTIHTWKKKHEEFANAVSEGKLNPDKKVEAALYKSAVEDGSNTAQIFWLKNRRPQEWRDKTETQVTTLDENGEETGFCFVDAPEPNEK